MITDLLETMELLQNPIHFLKLRKFIEDTQGPCINMPGAFDTLEVIRKFCLLNKAIRDSV